MSTGFVLSFLDETTGEWVAVTLTNPLPVTGGGGGGGVSQGHVTLAAPVYADGTDQDLSLTTGGDLRTFDAQVYAALTTPVPYMAPPPVVPATDTTLSYGTTNLTGVFGDQSLLAAVVGQSHRIHRCCWTFTGGTGEVLVTIKRGATAIGYIRVPETGLILDRDFCSYWLWKTANNEAFILSPASALNIDGQFEYVTSA